MLDQAVNEFDAENKEDNTGNGNANGKPNGKE